MNRAPLDAAFGLTLMVAGAMIAVPENLKAKSPPHPHVAVASAQTIASLDLCETAKAEALAALQQSDMAAYERWEQRGTVTCQAAGY